MPEVVCSGGWPARAGGRMGVSGETALSSARKGEGAATATAVSGSVCMACGGAAAGSEGAVSTAIGSGERGLSVGGRERGGDAARSPTSSGSSSAKATGVVRSATRSSCSSAGWAVRNELSRAGLAVRSGSSPASLATIDSAAGGSSAAAVSAVIEGVAGADSRGSTAAGCDCGSTALDENRERRVPAATGSRGAASSPLGKRAVWASGEPLPAG